MKECKKMIVLIMVFALCFGFSACGGGGSDNNDTVENEDDRGSGGSESDIYDSTDTVQYMASMESDNDNPAKQLGYSSIEEMCRWGEAEERRNAGYDRTKIVMQIIKSNVRRKM